MNIKQMIKRLNELAAMSPSGKNAPVVIASGRDGDRELFDRCRPKLVEMVEASFIPGEFYREADNDDRDEDVVKGVVIEDSSCLGNIVGPKETAE